MYAHVYEDNLDRVFVTLSTRNNCSHTAIRGHFSIKWNCVKTAVLLKLQYFIQILCCKGSQVFIVVFLLGINNLQ